MSWLPIELGVADKEQFDPGDIESCSWKGSGDRCPALVGLPLDLGSFAKSDMLSLR